MGLGWVEVRWEQLNSSDVVPEAVAAVDHACEAWHREGKGQQTRGGGGATRQASGATITDSIS